MSWSGHLWPVYGQVHAAAAPSPLRVTALQFVVVPFTNWRRPASATAADTEIVPETDWPDQRSDADVARIFRGQLVRRVWSDAVCPVDSLATVAGTEGRRRGRGSFRLSHPCRPRQGVSRPTSVPTGDLNP